MKYRSPLITLVAVVVWFAVMLTVNMVVHPGRGSAAAQPNTSPPPSSSPSPTAPATASTPATSPSQTPPARPKDPYPAQAVYAGHTKDRSLGVAIAVLNTHAAAYLCDGRQLEAWLRGGTSAEKVTLSARTGARIEAKLKNTHLEGYVELAGHRHSFSIPAAKKPAGIYRARGSKTTIGWIVLPDGSQVGLATDPSGHPKPAPHLDPQSTHVSADGEHLSVEPVTGETTI